MYILDILLYFSITADGLIYINISADINVQFIYTALPNIFIKRESKLSWFYINALS